MSGILMMIIAIVVLGGAIFCMVVIYKTDGALTRMRKLRRMN